MRLNKFFTQFVAELTFASGNVPDGDILQWLMKCVAFKDRTKEFSIFNCKDVVDPTPVLRSFLLKLFLQSGNSHVTEHLDDVIKGWYDAQDDLMIQHMVLLIDCFKVIVSLHARITLTILCSFWDPDKNNFLNLWI